MPSNKKHYRIGTRGSLLAKSQCSQIRDQLIAATGDDFELIFITTQGDQIADVPLWQVEGKDFFTRELDRALLEGQVDLVVHSYKDLGSLRPEGIKLAAVTERHFANDVLLIKKETIPLLKTLPLINVGTSAPRRMSNITQSLRDYLPAHADLKVQTQVLRGNVNTRIEKLQRGDYHAIVLAMAGLERLCQQSHKDPEVKKEWDKLLVGLDFMILAQSDFPSSASQGALGIECKAKRDDDGELEKKLQQLHHPITAQEVQKERALFASYEGGCHLPLGIHVRSLGPDKNYFWHSIKGQYKEEQINRQYLEYPQANKASPKLKEHEIFLGQQDDFLIQKTPLKQELSLDHGHYLVSTIHAWNHPRLKSATHLWAAGASTMKKLARLGLWVHGHADSLGEEEVGRYLKGYFLQMITGDKSPQLKVLTHKDSTSAFEMIEGYTRQIKTLDQIGQAQKEKMKEVKACYWSSFKQYQAYVETFPTLKNAIHACGLGKSWESFLKTNINVEVFKAAHDFTKWCLGDTHE